MEVNEGGEISLLKKEVSGLKNKVDSFCCETKILRYQDVQLNAKNVWICKHTQMRAQKHTERSSFCAIISALYRFEVWLHPC